MSVKGEGKNEKLKGRYQYGNYLWIKSVPTSLAVVLHAWTKGKAFRFGHVILLGMTLWPRTEFRFNCRHVPCAAGKGRASPALGSS